MPTRHIYLLGFLLIMLLLAISAYLEVFAGIIPCPLCSLQRATFGFLGILFLLGLGFYTLRIRIGGVIVHTLLVIAALMGIILSGRQIWLQHFPPSLGTECGVSLQYLLEALPLREALQKVFEGGPECSQRGWQFLSLNMAEWSLLCFAGFLFFALYLSFRGLKE